MRSCVPNANSPLPAPTRDVLIIEDDPTASMLLASVIGAMGHRATTAATGAEAALHMHDGTPDLVLLDLGLPDANGLELARQLHESHPAGTLPIIFVSGDQNPGTRVDAFAAGATDFVTKPYDIGEIRARVSHQLEMLQLRRSLDQARTTLEQRVQDRTRELATRMDELDAEIVQRRALEMELRRLAETDPLTELLNRRGLTPRLDQWLGGHPRALVVAVEVDHWESVVGLLGDAHGDEVLRSLAHRLVDLEPEGPVGCLGRSQFIVATRDRGRATARFLDEVRQVFESPVTTGEGELRLSTSIGATAARGVAGPAADDLLRDARLALYASKHEDGATVLLDDDDRRSLRIARELENDLWGAVEGNELTLRYQPVFSAEDGRMESMEALVRWQHPSRGELGPGLFIPIAERSGAIHEIGAWTLNESCRQFAEWREAGIVDRDGSVAVNLSALEVMDRGLVQRVTAAIETARLSPENLTLEVTETAVVGHLAIVSDSLRELRELGVGICLDDFGTGYSSLTILREVPATVVKIDRSFVAELGEHSTSGAIVETLIALAHRLDQRVVAEGIETAEQLRLLLDVQCDALQGFHLAPPLGADEIATLMRASGVPWVVTAP